MYLCGPGKHSCQPFCGPEGRFYCSDSVCSLWPAPFSYLCVSMMILCVCWKLSAAEQVKTDCRLRLLWSPLYWLRCLCLVLWPLRSITHITYQKYTSLCCLLGEGEGNGRGSRGGEICSKYLWGQVTQIDFLINDRLTRIWRSNGECGQNRGDYLYLVTTWPLRNEVI